MGGEGGGGKDGGGRAREKADGGCCSENWANSVITLVLRCKGLETVLPGFHSATS